MKRSMILIASLTSALLLAGCDQAEEETQATDESQSSVEETASTNDESEAMDTAPAEDATTTYGGGDAAAGEDEDAAAGDAEETTADATNDDADAETASIAGSVTYRERMALPEDAELTVQLLDVTLADAEAVTLAEQTLVPEQQVPIDFALDYDAAELSTDGRYALAAEIVDAEGTPLWATVDPHSVELGENAEPEAVELVLQRVAEDEDADSDEASADDEAADEETADEGTDESA